MIDVPNSDSDDKYLPTISRAHSLAKRSYLDVRSVGTPEQNNSSLSDYWVLIKRRKLSLILCTLLGGIIGFGFLLSEDPVYMASTTIELQGFNESFMNMAAVDPQAGTGSYSATQSNINTQIKIIESGSVRMPVLERLRRETTPITPPSRDALDKLRLRLRRGPLDPLQAMRSGLSMASFSLKARSVTGTRIIAVMCESTIPDIAANFANTIATEYIAQNTQLRSTSTQKTSQWLESQVEETRVKLEESESRLGAFVKKTGVIFVGDQDTLATSKLKQLTADLAAIQGDRIAKEAKYEMVKSSPPDSIPDVVDDPRMREYESKLVEANRQLAQLTATLTPEHYRVKQVQEQITALRAAMLKERGDVMQRIKNEYDAAVRKETLLKAAYAMQAGTISAQADKASEYGLLKREVDMYKQTLNAMLSQVNQAAVVSAVPANNIRIIDPAFPAFLPYKPDTSYYIGIGIILGLGTGFGLALMRERASKQKSRLTFGVPGYAPSVMAVPELGVIPSADFGTEREMRRWRRSRGPVTLNSDVSTVAEPKEAQLLAWQNRPSLLAESFRLAITSLMLMNRNGNRPRLLVVTSPGPEEGKTTVASNAAIALAEAGQNVLLIDMDLRRPRLHAVFGLTNDHGFSDLVRDVDPIKIIDPSSIYNTPIRGVSVLTSGALDINGISELFHSPRVPGLLRQLRQRFDTVLIDTPPVLQFSETRLVASLADGVILVLRSGVTDRKNALAAREQLAMDGIDLVGTILNDWNPKLVDQNTYSNYYTAYMKYQETDKK